MPDKQPFTTRRGFIAALGFGAVSLYGLWAGYGAAPSPLALLKRMEDGGHSGGGHDGGGQGGQKEPAEAPPEGGHGGHGAASNDIDSFRQQAEAFAERYRLPDGSVYPRPLEAAPEMQMDHGSGHGGMSMNMTTDHSGNDPMSTVDAASQLETIDVYLLAYQWGYTPDVLRLDAGQPYRFRMMAADVTHGASIQLGQASRIIRLRPGAVTEQVLTFKQPGEHLIYCTVYCGMAHDAMKGRIIVV